MNSKLLAAIVILLVVVAAAAYLASRGVGGAPAATTVTPSPTTQTTQALAVVKIGGLHPLSGDLATLGKADAEATILAAEDVNKYLEQKGANWRVELVVVDTGTDPETAKSKFDTLYRQGIRFFVGPLSSGELAPIVNLIQQGYKAVVVSYGSTAPSLALKDTVFRFPPPDEFQGKVLARLYQTDGVTHIIIVYRNDDWGSGLADAIKQHFTRAGGVVADEIPYDPQATNFANIVEQVKNDVESLMKQGIPPSEIGVDILSFEEAANILELASKYEVLKQVKWYGSDGSVLSQVVIQSPDAAAFAAAVKWPNTVTFSLTNKTGELFCRIKQRIGYSPDPYSLIAYDSVWVLALAIERAGGPNASVDAVAQAIPEVLKDYVGVSGKIVINEYGDRAASDYGVFDVVKTQSGYEWKLVAIYRFEKDAFEPVTGDPLACK